MEIVVIKRKKRRDINSLKNNNYPNINEWLRKEKRKLTNMGIQFDND